MSIDYKINYHLNKFPALKKVIKRGYQTLFYLLSDKKKVEGNLVRVSPQNDRFEYFFGYYDKSPWDIKDRYILCLRVEKTWEEVSPKQSADIILIDTHLPESDSSRIKKVAETVTWNVQQGCMLQWLGQDNKIIFNDFRNNRYCSVILDLDTMFERVINCPVYSVSSDGKIALSLDFSRLYNLRPGYGYHNVPELTEGEALPDSTAIWKINLETGYIEELLSYKDFASFQPRIEMETPTTIHKVNHIMISPDSSRFMVLYRFYSGRRKYSRLITCGLDGKEMYLLSDDDMVSHCFWRNSCEILAYENKRDTGPGYYLMKDRTQSYKRCWSDILGDGHPSYSPCGKWIVTDTYPDKTRKSHLYLMVDGGELREFKTIVRVFAPFRYDNDTRCDLHPRWNRAGNEICIDSVFEGKRGLYIVKIDSEGNVL